MAQQLQQLTDPRNYLNRYFKDVKRIGGGTFGAVARVTKLEINSVGQIEEQDMALKLVSVRDYNEVKEIVFMMAPYKNENIAKCYGAHVIDRTGLSDVWKIDVLETPPDFSGPNVMLAIEMELCQGMYYL